MHDFGQMSDLDKIKSTLCFLQYLLTDLLKIHNMPLFQKDSHHSIYKNKIILKKIGYSPARWGNKYDKSMIYENPRVSVIYNVKVQGHQYSRIRNSMLLKAIIG